MRKYIILFVIFALIAFPPFTAAETEKTPPITLNIATIDWCPAICESYYKTGFMRELVTEVFKDSSVTIVFHFMPWIRAVREVEHGKMDALLSPVKSEAPALLYPEFELGQQSTCFYVAKDDPWRYQDSSSSFQDRKVVLVKGNSLLDLDQYISQHPEIFTYLTFTDFIERAIMMMSIKRINTFVYTKTEAEFQLKNNGMGDDFQNAGCVSTMNLYLAFAHINPERSNNLIKLYDRNMSLIRKNNKVEAIMANYGLNDWR